MYIYICVCIYIVYSVYIYSIYMYVCVYIYIVLIIRNLIIFYFTTLSELIIVKIIWRVNPFLSDNLTNIMSN